MEVSGQLHAANRCTQWLGGWLDPRACLEAVAKERFTITAGNQTPVIQSVV